MPAIEIRYHGHGGVADLRLARELGLWHVCHANYCIAEVLIRKTFRKRGELRTLYADVGTIADRDDTLGHRGLRDMNPQAGRNRMCHRNVRHTPLTKERVLTLVGALDKLID